MGGRAADRVGSVVRWSVTLSAPRHARTATPMTREAHNAPTPTQAARVPGPPPVPASEQSAHPSWPENDASRDEHDVPTAQFSAADGRPSQGQSYHRFGPWWRHCQPDLQHYCPGRKPATRRLGAAALLGHQRPARHCGRGGRILPPEPLALPCRLQGGSRRQLRALRTARASRLCRAPTRHNGGAGYGNLSHLNRAPRQHYGFTAAAFAEEYTAPAPASRAPPNLSWAETSASGAAEGGRAGS